MAGVLWAVSGGSVNGSIESDGVYIPPATVPPVNPIIIACTALGQTATGRVNVLNPIPTISAVQPATIVQLSSTVTVAGNGFLSGSTILINGNPIPTTFVDSAHVSATVSVAMNMPPPLTVTVFNPDPGGIISNQVSMPVAIAPLTIFPQTATVRVGGTVSLNGNQLGSQVTGGTWLVAGGSQNGTINSSGTYTPPSVLPATNVITVTYAALGQSTSATITILNAIPSISQVAPATLNELDTTLSVAGGGFVGGSQVVVGGTPVATTFLDSMHLVATVLVPNKTATSVSIAVSNPDPGAILSQVISIPVAIAPLFTSPQTAQVRLGSTLVLTAEQSGSALTGGMWSVKGGSTNGTIGVDGIYSPPPTIPSSSSVTINYTYLGQTASSTLSLLSPQPQIDQVIPVSLTRISTQVTLVGSGFTEQSMVLAGAGQATTTYVDSRHLIATVVVASIAVASLSLSVSNPDPGAIVSNQAAVSVSIPPITISPALLTGGNNTVVLTIPGLPSSAVVTMDGTPLTTVASDQASITASGYLPFWQVTSSSIAVLPFASAAPLASLQVPIAPTSVPYDVAARFAMQAAFGPRHDIIEHIQQIGLAPFVDEQLQMPPPVYTEADSGRRDFLTKLVSDNSLLRMRVAWAFQSFMPGQGIFVQPSVLPWEETLEAHAFGNYRQIMEDSASDPNLTTLLNLPGNWVSTALDQHPNQNFAREFLQLFTIGPVMLNDDGTIQTDALGAPVASYGEDTIDSISRGLTGWTYGPEVNSAFFAYGIDYTQPLVPLEFRHDKGTKVIFGNTTLPAGQTTTQDREQILDAVFKHQNVPPFVSRRLIQRLVKSQPSAAYIGRMSAVFKDDGKGVRGNLAAVIKAILLDPEARVGDTKPSTDDGYLQDPLFSLIFAMILMDIGHTDGSASFYPDQLGEPWWFTHSIFAFYSPDYKVPGTTINSPEFQLLTSTLIVQRSQLLWGIINGPQVGFEPWGSTWLNETFPTLPSFVDALNHLLYHGTMPAAEKDAILDYCNGVSDPPMQLRSALMLALNGDAYTVVQ